METKPLFYVCFENKLTGRRDVKLHKKPLTYKEALELVERYYPHSWANLKIGIRPVDCMSKK